MTRSSSARADDAAGLFVVDVVVIMIAPDGQLGGDRRLAISGGGAEKRVSSNPLSGESPAVNHQMSGLRVRWPTAIASFSLERFRTDAETPRQFLLGIEFVDREIFRHRVLT